MSDNQHLGAYKPTDRYQAVRTRPNETTRRQRAVATVAAGA